MNNWNFYVILGHFSLYALFQKSKYQLLRYNLSAHPIFFRFLCIPRVIHQALDNFNLKDAMNVL